MIVIIQGNKGKKLVQVQSLIPRDVKVQRLKKLYIQIILTLSLTIVAVITYSMDTSLNQSMIIEFSKGYTNTKHKLSQHQLENPTYCGNSILMK
jgi:hypothetical protein